MTIQICPINRLYQILTEGDIGKCGAIINSASEIDAEKVQCIPYVFQQYKNLDYECPGRSFSKTDAGAYADFVKNLEADVLYCCCDAAFRFG